MMRVRCEKYPELLIGDLGVRFHAGIANVDNNKAIQAMKAMDGFGFVYEDAPDAEEVPKPQAKRGRRTGGE